MKELINKYLKNRGKSIKDILPTIEMTEAGYYAAIRNDSLKISTLKKIAAALQVPISVFFSENDAKAEIPMLEEPTAAFGNQSETIKALKDTIKAQETTIKAQEITIYLLQQADGPKIAKQPKQMKTEKK